MCFFPYSLQLNSQKRINAHKVAETLGDQLKRMPMYAKRAAVKAEARLIGIPSRAPKNAKIAPESIGKDNSDNNAFDNICYDNISFTKDNSASLMQCSSSNLCKNGGTCYLMKNNPICKCTDDFLGDSCQDYNYCEPNLCKYYGTCSSLNGGFQCLQEEYNENKNENSVYFNETVAWYTNTTFNVFFDEFVISFDILLTTNDVYVLMFDPDFITFRSFIGIDMYLVINGFKSDVQIKISPYAWNSLELSQHYSSDDTSYNTNLYLNGTLIYSFSNLQPKVFTDITLHVFGSCINNVCTSGSIKNLNIISKTQVFWSQWSEWSSCSASVVERTRICNSNQWLNCTGDSNEAYSCSNDLCQGMLLLLLFLVCYCHYYL
ncbi:uncharacterized protein LOC136080237 [Hydra vulgaris]|uniref:Uncharacterized protein LOC136080237 n=1 Tax=Hydra vulgaris TaxID=6087 RepID=A0ABM4BUS1_HYDVU